MSNLDALVAESLADPLRLARAAVQTGRRAIGYVGIDVPAELILSASALPVLMAGAPDAETPNADRYLEESFPPAIRSIAEQWITGELDCLDAVVFPRSDDAAQRLYYYLCELQRRALARGPRPLIYDVARIRRATSRGHTIAATHALGEQLGAQADGLKAAFAHARQREALFARLNALRNGPHTIPGSTAYRIFRAAQYAWDTRFDNALAQWLESPPQAASRRRLILAGSAPPDERIHVAVESAGATIVADLYDGSLGLALRRSTPERVSLDALGVACHEAASFARLLVDAPDALVESVREANADGVILWAIEEDEGVAWELPGQVTRLTRAGIPTLLLTRQRWAIDADGLATIASFVRNLPVSA